MNSFLRSAYLVTATLCCITLSSCEREPESGPNAEGVNGAVKIYNVYGEEQDPSGVTVTLEQTGKSTKTEADGSYVLPYLESGNYTLKFTKAGHPTTYQHDVEHVRTRYTSTPVPLVRMIEPSTFYVTEPAVTRNNDTNNNPYFAISGKLNKPVPAGKKIKVKLYLGKDEAVSVANYVHTFTYEITSQEFTINYPYFASLIINNEMKRGDTVYMVMFTDAVVEDNCDGPWQKPICTNSSTINTTNPVVISGQIPQL
ncbi:carboxypeptidase-like regulatory domain-containing protein [Pontibacter sp. H259]|uniref:carboxypeptidase-like regulatory domain-containing protein n=1 Tax=Pontibacter sp. H259 TaxID=3133421 RepID=UPI0030BD6C48